MLGHASKECGNCGRLRSARTAHHGTSHQRHCFAITSAAAAPTGTHPPGNPVSLKLPPPLTAPERIVSRLAYPSSPAPTQEVTCPFGAVNAHTAMAPERGGYAVPDSFLATSLTNGPHAFPQRPGMTTYRGDFAQREEQDVARSIRAAQELTEQSHKALLRSTLPLGRNAPGLVQPSQWISEMKDEYVERPGAAGASLRANVEQAEGLRAMFNGPTASVGKVATLREFAGRP